MSKRKKGEQPISTTLSADLLARLSKEAVSRRLNKKDLIAAALIEYLNVDQVDRYSLSDALKRIEAKLDRALNQLAESGA